MNSNVYENIYSPRKNEINEDNLNFLNEEASNYLDDNDENYQIKSEKFSNNRTKFGSYNKTNNIF